MKKLLAVVSLCLVGISSPALAVKYLVTTGGEFIRDPETPTLFGSAANTISWTMSFVVDSDDANYAPSGTSVGNGNTLQYDSISFRNWQISDLVYHANGVAPGFNEFSESNFLSQSAGSIGFFDVLIQGTLSDISAIAFNMAKQPVGEITIGALECPASTCSVTNFSYGYSYADNGFGLGDPSKFYVRSQMLNAVPEPATWAMIIGGFALAGTTLRRRKSTISAA